MTQNNQHRNPSLLEFAKTYVPRKMNEYEKQLIKFLELPEEKQRKIIAGNLRGRIR